MSQNTLVTDSKFGRVRVSAGWDHPTQEAFCNVLTLDEDEDDEESDIEYPPCFMRTSYSDAQEMVRALSEAGITLPSAMVAAIDADIESGARNVLRQFRQDGSIEREDTW